MTNAEKFEKVFGIDINRIFGWEPQRLDAWLDASADDGWTPCKERPPKKGIPVIVTVKWAEDDVEVCTAKMSDDGYIFSDYGLVDDEKVLAWMPQTDPYEGGAE